MRLLDAKSDKVEIGSLKQEIQTKCERADVDIYVRAV
jgi:hypothetical protein